ncbi:MAG: hypothetical protein HKP58_20185 [Desulfatitalea sp.]|nr:hypothetical protein [Desulfatitalea sp.]NNK02737.1 hypothetical protein [Desulfatitalea sp.]
MINQTILNAFNTMWQNFPEPVMLIQKDRTILAVNAMAQSAGIQPGIKCFTLNPEEKVQDHCSLCRADQALSAGRAEILETTLGDKPATAYWVPLDGSDSLYLHFTTGYANMLGLKTGT